jgi:hypothetical protein
MYSLMHSGCITQQAQQAKQGNRSWEKDSENFKQRMHRSGSLAAALEFEGPEL